MSGPPRVVRVAAAQIPARTGRPDPSVVTDAVAEAAAAGARLVVLPELALCGGVFADAAEARAAAEPADGPTTRLLRTLSRRHDCVLVAGFAELGTDGRVYNSATLVADGEQAVVYRKVHLWDREKELFSAGSAPPPVVATAAGRIAVMICYDAEFPEWVRLAVQRGAEIVAVCANWPWLPHPPGERPLEVIRAQASAGAYRVHVVVADRCGPDRGATWIGGSVVCSAHGWALAGPAAGERVVLVADVDLAQARDKQTSAHNDALADRRPALYGEPTADAVAPHVRVH